MQTARERVEKALEIARNALPTIWEQSTDNPNRVNNALTGNLVASVWPEGCTPPHNSTHTFSRHIATMDPQFAQALLQGWLTMHDAMAEWTKDGGFECWYLIYNALASARKKLEELK